MRTKPNVRTHTYRGCSWRTNRPVYLNWKEKSCFYPTLSLLLQLSYTYILILTGIYYTHTHTAHIYIRLYDAVVIHPNTHIVYINSIIHFILSFVLRLISTKRSCIHMLRMHMPERGEMTMWKGIAYREKQKRVVDTYMKVLAAVCVCLCITLSLFLCTKQNKKTKKCFIDVDCAYLPIQQIIIVENEMNGKNGLLAYITYVHVVMCLCMSSYVYVKEMEKADGCIRIQ